MNDEHIQHWLERGPLSELSAAELAQLRAHTAGCAACRQAYAAARLAAALCQTRAAVTVEPPPFFQTRVLAAWRAQQAQAELSPFLRWWRAASGLVAGMAAAVVLLVVLTFATGETRPAAESLATADYFSVESVVALDTALEELTDEQVLNALYVTEESTAESREEVDDDSQ
jgi:hypothetical protein